MCVLKFAAVRTSVLVTSGTLPSGRHEAVAVRIGTAMNELRFLRVVVVCVVVVCVVLCLTHEMMFGGE